MKKKILLILILLIVTSAAACSGNSSTTSESGVEGRVVIGPVCPVIQQGGENCIDRPYPAALTVNDPQGRKIVQVEADEDGLFKIPLEPGNYILVPEANGLMVPFALQQPFTVEERKYTQLTIAYDSGIR